MASSHDTEVLSVSVAARNLISVSSSRNVFGLINRVHASFVFFWLSVMVDDFQPVVTLLMNESKKIFNSSKLYSDLE